MRIADLSKLSKLSSSRLNCLAREGFFKTAVKIKENHLIIWYISDEEAYKFIKNRK